MFDKVILVQYNEIGYSKEICNELSGPEEVKIVKYDDVGRIVDEIKSGESVLIDVTGLYKPIIFEVIRQSILMGKDLSVVHTLAQSYYPLNSDIQKLIDNRVVDDATRFADLMRGLTTGDEGDYRCVRLLGNNNYDPIRPTALVGFVSPKNQRIFSILDKTEYESINLFIPKGNTARDILSQTAGNIALTNYSGVRLRKFDTLSPSDVLKEISCCYAELYIDQNYNFEISLTGSKMQTVAAAVFSSVCKISQCWYVEPSRFDTNHFTKGVGETTWYTVNMLKGDSVREEL